MIRGGSRKNAGRKTTWHSGIKFEDTTTIRVPNYIKEKLLRLAHRLDAGEDIKSASNSKKTNEKINELEQQILLLQSESKKLELALSAAQMENCRLQEKLKKLDTKNEGRHVQLKLFDI